MINGYPINVRRPDRCIIAYDGKYVLIEGIIRRDNESMRVLLYFGLRVSVAKSMPGL